VAEVSEPSSEVIDMAMMRLGGEVVRRSVSGAEAEIASAEEAGRAARTEARKQLRKAKRQARGRRQDS
jgi:regulator of protease activity HflC (stomatin/prohibitin superfamily)